LASRLADSVLLGGGIGVLEDFGGNGLPTGGSLRRNQDFGDILAE